MDRVGSETGSGQIGSNRVGFGRVRPGGSGVAGLIEQPGRCARATAEDG